MESSSLCLKTNEVVTVTVVREGNLEEPTYVGWKTDDETAQDGKHYIGGAGKLMSIFFTRSFHVKINYILMVEV